MTNFHSDYIGRRRGGRGDLEVLRAEARSMSHTDIMATVYAALLPVLGSDASSVATGLAVDLGSGEIDQWCGLFWLAEY